MALTTETWPRRFEPGTGTRFGANRFGATPAPEGVLFRVWAATDRLQLWIDGDPPRLLTSFTRGADGLLEIFVPGIGGGARYGYLLDGRGPFPDPASRFQPGGVHALSEVIDPGFRWTDANFKPAPWREAVIYEMHCGTFTLEGTFRAAAARLPALRDLGVTAVELMPVADFPGARNWGYDGVSLYAPSRNYGRPEDLRAFVDTAHSFGLAVYLDVVYNHLGPDGAYHRLFHPRFYSSAHQTPWGDGMNFDGEDSKIVRAFFIGNALHWIAEYHIDGFRLDATHAIQDDGPVHFLAGFSTTVHEYARSIGRQAIAIAEDSRNIASFVVPREKGGYGLDAVWADDLHHQVRRALTGDSSGYFAGFTGSPADIAATLRNGWFYEGQHSLLHGKPRGTPTDGIDRNRFIVCIDNHDQSGNRALGDRLQQRVPRECFLAASALILLAPETPLLFMGQEWASTSPFRYFTDHHEELGRLVTEGRFREFADFPEFAGGPNSRIPDPQAFSTFVSSKLRWQEREQPEHSSTLDWYTRLIALRRSLLREGREWEVREQGGVVVIEWRGARDTVTAAIALDGARTFEAQGHSELVLSSESFLGGAPHQPSIPGCYAFPRAGCVVLRGPEGAR